MRMKNALGLAAGLAATALGARMAGAQPEYEQPAAPPPPVYQAPPPVYQAPPAYSYNVQVVEVKVRRPATGIGILLEGGLGALGFSQAAMDSLASAGVSWNVRLIFGTRSYIGAEAYYQGGAQSINTFAG